MIDSVFISDLHLHPQDVLISNRFARWVDWAVLHVKQVYILGDFFHAWAGDDTLDAWSLGIAEQLMRFKKQHIPVFFMHGNRDFLLGRNFAHLSKCTLLDDPAVIDLYGVRTLLMHGDSLCTKDKTMQFFRLVTRHRWCKKVFLMFPVFLRKGIAHWIQDISQKSRRGEGKPKEIWQWMKSWCKKL